MTITDDYIIFADKYHNKQHMPDDIIKLIMDINTKNIQKEKRKNFDKVVKELNDFKEFFKSDRVVNNLTYVSAVQLIQNKTLCKKPGDEDFMTWRRTQFNKWYHLFDNLNVINKDADDLVCAFMYDTITTHDATWYLEDIDGYGTPRYCRHYYRAYNYLFYILAVTDKNYVF